MKNKLQSTFMVLALLLIPGINFGQVAKAPNLKTVANFVLFSNDGLVSNTGTSQLTGNVGSNNGGLSNFGNVNGVMHDKDAATGQAKADLLVVCDSINASITKFNIAVQLGNGQILIPGVYAIGAPANLDLVLTLDGQGDPNAVFIIKILGTLNESSNAKVKLINKAQACNVFWKVQGQISIASGATMKGTVIADNAAFIMNTNDTLEGRAISTTGAITVNGIMAYTPIGCNIPLLTGPKAPTLGAAACYALFSTDGYVINTGTTKVTGDVGSNKGSAAGYSQLDVTGQIHLIPDGSTAQCAADLLLARTYADTIKYDIELLDPINFGRGLVLTPHVYRMNAAATLTDTLYLNALGDPNAVFIIQVNGGALAAAVKSTVKLINGTQAKNVFWKVDGEVDVYDHAVFCGTIIGSGAVKIFNTVTLNGRAMTTVGALTTDAMNIVASVIPLNCGTVGISSIEVINTEAVTIYPNPFSTSATILVNDVMQNNKIELRIYNVLGAEVMNTIITKQSTMLETSNLSSGVYFYKVISNNNIIQSGKLVSQK